MVASCCIRRRNASSCASAASARWRSARRSDSRSVRAVSNSLRAVSNSARAVSSCARAVSSCASHCSLAERKLKEKELALVAAAAAAAPTAASARATAADSASCARYTAASASSALWRQPSASRIAPSVAFSAACNCSSAACLRRFSAACEGEVGAPDGALDDAPPPASRSREISTVSSSLVISCSSCMRRVVSMRRSVASALTISSSSPARVPAKEGAVGPCAGASSGASAFSSICFSIGTPSANCLALPRSSSRKGGKPFPSPLVSDRLR